MENKLAILWDLDGTLVDATELHYKSWKITPAEHDINFSREKFLATYGWNNRAILTDSLGFNSQKLVEEISQHKASWFRNNVDDNVILLPGVLDWLERFINWGFPQAIATSAPLANIFTLTDATGIRSYFDALASAENLPSKPNPAVFLKAAKMLNTPPEQCLVIEDAPSGIEGAKRAGMKCLAVLTTNSAEKMQSANFVVESMDKFNIEDARSLLKLTSL